MRNRESHIKEGDFVKLMVAPHVIGQVKSIEEGEFVSFELTLFPTDNWGTIKVSDEYVRKLSEGAIENYLKKEEKRIINKKYSPLHSLFFS